LNGLILVVAIVR